MSQIEHACPSSRPPFRAGTLLSTTFLTLASLYKEYLGMTKTKIAAVRVKMNRAGIKPDLTIPRTTQYLVPDEMHIGRCGAASETGAGPVWIPPGESTGTRLPDKKNVISFRGAIHHFGDNRKVVFESMVENRVAKVLLARRDVVELRDQWPEVHYVDAAGVLRSHTFDFWVRLANGKRVAVAVKAAARVRQSRVVTTLKSIAAQGIGGHADEVALLTDAYATHDEARNAEWKLHARRMRNEAAYQDAFAIVANIRGVVRFHDLLQDASHPAARRIAIWNLIDEGYLAAIEPGRITDLSWLIRATQN